MDFDRMERLINQLLVLARMDEANGNAPAGEVDLPALLAELAATYDARAAAGGGAVLCQPLPPTRIGGEPALLERLFVNLLDNALKHGPAGGTIRLTLRHEPDGTCTVGVHDEGGNIPPEALGRLFDRFFRVDDCAHAGHRRHGAGAGHRPRDTRCARGGYPDRLQPRVGHAGVGPPAAAVTTTTGAKPVR